MRLCLRTQQSDVTKYFCVVQLTYATRHRNVRHLRPIGTMTKWAVVLTLAVFCLAVASPINAQGELSI